MPKSKTGYISYETSASFIVSVVNLLLSLALKICKDKDKGGYFTVMDKTRGVILGSARIGNPPIKKSIDYFNLSIEKATRLFLHKGHSTSRQSRDKKKEQYGGAVRGKSLILSFSGLPEIWDETLVISAMVFCNELTFRKANKITNRKIRRAFHQLLAALYNEKRLKR